MKNFISKSLATLLFTALTFSISFAQIERSPAELGTLENTNASDQVKPAADDASLSCDELEANFEVLQQGDLTQFILFVQGRTNLVRWDFGDGTVSYELNPQHIYKKRGLYRVTLIIRNQCTTLVTSDYIRVGM